MHTILFWASIFFCTGLITGRLLFSDSRPRKLLQLHRTAHGWDVNQLAGLFASVAVRRAPKLIPKVIFETEKTLVFEHPRPKFKTHYLFVPKKDIKNIGELTAADLPYLDDLLATLTTVIQSHRLTDYRLWTNGPGRQDVAYLHFHLGADA